jgi:uncharacterized protein (TIGR00159 family)
MAYIASFFNIIQYFQVKDLIDLLIITALMYVLLRLLKETHSTSVVVGVVMIASLYGLATVFHLQLTTIILKSFFSTFLVILAVVFQRELRRFFSFFSFFRFTQVRRTPSMEVITIVAASMFELVQRRLGALVVFPGQEAISRHMEGGYELKGEVSAPLILSIFDETSPGHDGAVVIQDNLLKIFGVHLPLAENLEKVKGYGLRHRAALGLAERSDALVLVVSQEKGQVSVAHNGKVSKVAGEQELVEILDAFYKEKFPHASSLYIGSWLKKNGKLLLSAFLIAFLTLIAVRLQIASIF